MEFDNKTIVLCDKRWLDLWKVTLLPVALVMAGMTAALVFSLTVIFPDAPWQKLPQIIARQLGAVDWSHALLNHFDLIFPFGVIVGQILYLNRAQRVERLTLSATGISYTSPLPQLLKRFKPDWSLAWGDIRKVELGTLNLFAPNPEFVLLTFHSATGTKRLFPERWVDADHHSRPAFSFRFTLSSASRENVLDSVLSSEVMRYIAGNFPEIPVEQTPGSAQRHTSLEKDPHGKKALGIVALLIVYALADFVAGPDAYVDDPSELLHIFIPAGVAGAVLAGVWLYRSVLPAGEKTGLAFLIGILVAVAMVPAALRINALTAPDGGSRYEYRVLPGIDRVVLRPVVEGMPVIEYFSKNGFWGKFGANDTYPVLLRKGALGFYQFDASVIVDDIRKHQAGR